MTAKQTGPILLVEDNPSDVDLTLYAFKKHNLSNRIVVAADGEQALELLIGTRAAELGQQPALVLLDLKLPKIDGLEVLRRVRADERTRRLAIVVLTSSDEEQDLLQSYDLGVNSYVRKPIDFAEFLDAVRHLGLYWLILNEAAPALRPPPA